MLPMKVGEIVRALLVSRWTSAKLSSIVPSIMLERLCDGVWLGTLVPSAPANVGSYQFFTVLGLTLFGVEKATAAGFSLVVFTVLTAPLWAIELWALSSSGLHSSK
jgi:hypothetical protein